MSGFRGRGPARGGGRGRGRGRGTDSHTQCHFGEECTRVDCWHTHPQGRHIDRGAGRGGGRRGDAGAGGQMQTQIPAPVQMQPEECRYGEDCTKMGCSRVHPQGRHIDRGGRGGRGGAAGGGGQTQTQPEECRYGEDCTKMGCSRVHPQGRHIDRGGRGGRGGAAGGGGQTQTQPEECRYGEGCTKMGCTRLHPQGRHMDREGQGMGSRGRGRRGGGRGRGRGRSSPAPTGEQQRQPDPRERNAVTVSVSRGALVDSSVTWGFASAGIILHRRARPGDNGEPVARLELLLVSNGRASDYRTFLQDASSVERPDDALHVAIQAFSRHCENAVNIQSLDDQIRGSLFPLDRGEQHAARDTGRGGQRRSRPPTVHTLVMRNTSSVLYMVDVDTLDRSLQSSLGSLPTRSAEASSHRGAGMTSTSRLTAPATRTARRFEWLDLDDTLRRSTSTETQSQQESDTPSPPRPRLERQMSSADKLMEASLCAILEHADLKQTLDALKQPPPKSPEQLMEELQRRVEFHVNQAEAERPDVQAELDRLGTGRPPPDENSVNLPTDITPLVPSDRDYQRLAQSFGGQVQRVKRVNVPERDKKFQLYKTGLRSQHQVSTYHGTPAVANASAIARNGPDLNMAGSAHGTACGQGFYTARDTNTAEGYCRGSGSVCECLVLPGVTYNRGNSSTTMATLQGETPPCDSVHVNNGGATDWHILFHPDSVLVRFIVDFGDDDSKEAALHRALAQAIADWETEETQRQADLARQQGRFAQIDYFCRRSRELQDDAAPQTVKFYLRLWELELQQFQKGLPIYARKADFVDALMQHSALVLTAGTGTGKTVSSPQWLYDDILFCHGRGHEKVAVLVPRKSIAKGLAQYISHLRKCKVGGEVGLGVGDDVKIGSSSRLVFMTYGYFAKVSASSPHFQGWAAVILDEAHERNPDAELLLPRMVDACAARDDFKAIVMSATIDTTIFQRIFANQGVTCPVISVDGVTYEVEDHWGTEWDSRADGAASNLALDCVRIFNNDPRAGNMLVFLSSITQVQQLVEATAAMLQNDPNIAVLPLYASLPKEEQDCVAKFSDLDMFPDNEGKRAIVFSTNVAEAGITIPGISVVVDCGKEIEVVYEPAFRRNRIREVWISKASQRQRRGRAGRTAPGACYAMYSEQVFNEQFPEHTTPPIQRINIESHVLSLLLADEDPEAYNFLVAPSQESFDDASVSLRHLGAIRMRDGDEAQEESKGAVFVPAAAAAAATGAGLEMTVAAAGGATFTNFEVTPVGEMIGRIPVDLPMARSILAAAEDGTCSLELAIIACMVQEASKTLFLRGERGDQTKRDLAARSGDHETLLNVYEEWVSHDRSSRWCAFNHLSELALSRADFLLSKVRRSMGLSKIPICSMPMNDPHRSEAILRALCAGFFRNTAVPCNPTGLKDGYTLTEHHATNPTQAQHHRSSSIPMDTTNVKCVIFKEMINTPNDVNFLSVVSKVEPEWVEQAAQEWSAAVDFAHVLRDMKRVAKDIPIPTGVSPKLLSGGGRQNLRAIQREFPQTKIAVIDQQQFPGAGDASNSAGPPLSSGGSGKLSRNRGQGRKQARGDSEGARPAVVRVVCGDSILNQVEARLRQAFAALQEVTRTITNVPGSSILQHLGSQDAKQARKKQLTDRFGAWVQLKHPHTPDANSVVDVQVTTLAVVIDAAEAFVAHLLHGTVEHDASLGGIVAAASATGTAAPAPGVVHSMAQGAAAPAITATGGTCRLPEARRMTLLGATATVEQIFSEAGSGKEGSMLAMAHWISNNSGTGMFVYGGYLRDYVLRGDLHDDMDIDVSLANGMASPKDGLRVVYSWATSAGMHLLRQNPKGHDVLECIFQTRDGSATFPLEFVDVAKYESKDGQVDFDVNNLKFSATTCLALKFQNNGQNCGSVAEICQNCRNKHLRVLKPAKDVSFRISKMQARGWTVSIE